MPEGIDFCMLHCAGDPQHKITAQRKPDQKNRIFLPNTGNLLNGPEHFLKEYCIENSSIQMVTAAMVSQIQTKNIIAALIKGLARAGYIGRIDTAFPSVQ
jgi:hypothetical protein